MTTMTRGRSRSRRGGSASAQAKRARVAQLKRERLDMKGRVPLNGQNQARLQSIVAEIAELQLWLEDAARDAGADVPNRH
jgi:hypothetical protein